MSPPTVMTTSEKATQQSMTYPSLSVPNALQKIIDAPGFLVLSLRQLMAGTLLPLPY